MASNSDNNESTVTSTTTLTATTAADDRPVYTIADLGIRAVPQTQQTIVGPTRSLSSLTGYEWIYVSLSLTSLLVLIALTIERLISLRSSDPDFTFAFLLFWTTCFCFVYVIQGVFRERAFELIAFVSTVSIVLLYVIFNFTANKNQSTLKIVRLVITCLFGPILIVGGVMFSKRYFKSKNLIFRTVGANASMQRYCELLFLAESLLKFDAQFAGSALILWLKKGFLHWDPVDKVVVSAGAVYMISWIILGLLAIRLESKPIIYTFFLTSIFEPAIIIWDLIRYSLGPDDLALELSVYLAGIIAIIVRIVTVVVMTFVMFNFNKGLKQKVYGFKNRETTTNAETNEPIMQ